MSKEECPTNYPRNTRTIIPENSLSVKKPNVANEWHPTKNGIQTPNDFSCGSNFKVWWKCSNPTCNSEWLATITNRTGNNSGCPFCNNKIVTPEKSLFAINPKLASEWNYTLNKDLTPERVFPNSSLKFWWKCSNPDCKHEWIAAVSNRNTGETGCPSCRDHRKILTREKSLGFLYPVVALEWDEDGNSGKTPYDFFPHSSQIACWKCKRKQHKFSARIADKVSNKVICPECTKEFKTSFPEQAILFYLSGIFDNVQNRYLFDTGVRMEEIDVYISEIRVGIEYDGHKHTNKEKDEKKNDVLQKNHIHLIRIRDVGLPLLEPFGATIIYREDKHKNSSLRDCIVILGEILVNRYALSPIQNEKLKALREINIDQDSAEIYSRFLLWDKESSLAMLHPALLDEWDYDYNDGVDPNNASPGSHYLAGWICRECGHHFKTAIYHRTHPYTMRGKIYQGSSCPQCAKTKRTLTRRETMRNKPATSEQQNNRWEKKYSLLLEYKEEHGNCDVPKKHPELGKWVYTQRRYYTKGILSPERVAKLNSIGFTWRMK